MGLIKCPECDREMSNLADICPYCRYPIKQVRETEAEKGKGRKEKILGLIIVVGGLIYLFSYAIPKCSMP